MGIFAQYSYYIIKDGLRIQGISAAALHFFLRCDKLIALFYWELKWYELSAVWGAHG